MQGNQHDTHAQVEPDTQHKDFFRGFKTGHIKTSGATINTV
jgi:hypothetical protein